MVLQQTLWMLINRSISGLENFEGGCFCVISNVQRHVVSFAIPDTFWLEAINTVICQI